MIEITLNGTKREVPSDLTIVNLICWLGLVPAGIVVERNAMVVAPNELPTTVVGAGDVLEVIHMAGGGQ